MNLFEFTDSTLPVLDWSLQLTHLTGVMVALLIGLLPLITAKGSKTHREAGQIYLVCSLLVFGLGMLIAYRQAALLLFCFHGFFAYMLLSGWRALHRPARPDWIDWGILGILLVVALAVAVFAAHQANARAAGCFGLFALGCLGMVGHEAHDLLLPPQRASGWLNRHVAGMIGSLVAHFSVVVGNFLTTDWQWVLPALLAFVGALLALRRRWRQSMRERRLQKFLGSDWSQKFAPR
jgi:uncharacterized membrane protein YeaQ/YmgE (transglycosylase-associated protein family)